MLTGYQLTYNGRANTACYGAGLASAIGLELTPIPCAQDGGKLVGIDWAIPCSENGVSLTSFAFEKATGIVKPQADAVKVISVQYNTGGGTYGRWVVPDSYTASDFITACCAGCTPLPAVTIPAPFFFNGECTLVAPTIPACVYQGSFYVPALTGGNTTFTATPLGFDAAGVAITFAPGTSAATTVALLAAAMQTNWAAEMGSATFTAVGNTIDWTALIAKSFAVVITQS